MFFSNSRLSAQITVSTALFVSSLAIAADAQADVVQELAPANEPVASVLSPVTLETVDVAETEIEKPFEMWTAETLEEFISQNSCFENVWDNYDQANRVTLRSEFARALNDCIVELEENLPQSVSDEEDAQRWPMLQNAFQDAQRGVTLTNEELDALQERIFTLQENAFSTTTKLDGEIVFAFTDLYNDTSNRTVSLGTVNGQDVSATTETSDGEAIFGGYGKVTFNTSFSGDDRLFIRFRGGAVPTFFAANPVSGSNTVNGEGYAGGAIQTFNLGANTPTFQVQNLTVAYSFPMGDLAKLHLFGSGGIWSDFVPTLNPYFEDYDGGRGALTTFASNNPIYRIGGGSGIGLNYDLKFLESVVESATFSAGYLSPEVFLPDSYFGTNPRKQFGLFNGDYALMVQTDFQFSQKLALGLTYNHAYHPTNSAVFDMGGLGSQGVVGSQLANTGRSGVDAPQVTNSYGLSMAWQPSDAVSLSGFLTYVDGDILGSTNSGDYETWTYGMGVAFPDLFKDGSLLGFFTGAQPYVAQIKGATETFRNGEVPFHFEMFYRYPVNKYISVTPGLILLSDPNQIDGDAQIFTIRTTFKF